MGVATTIVAVLALAGVLVSWSVGAAATMQALRDQPHPGRGNAMLAVAAWPFMIGRLKDTSPPGYAIRVNKALVALFVCAMVGVAALSLATNLSRISR